MRRVAVILDVQHARDGLLLQPFPHIALVRGGACGQFGCSQRAFCGERR